MPSKPEPPVYERPTPAMPTEPMLQFFSTAHLREDLRPVSQAFADLAHEIAATLPRNPERTVALRKLLEAKDCAVRAALYHDDRDRTVQGRHTE